MSHHDCYFRSSVLLKQFVLVFQLVHYTDPLQTLATNPRILRALFSMAPFFVVHTARYTKSGRLLPCSNLIVGTWVIDCLYTVAWVQSVTRCLYTKRLVF